MPTFITWDSVGISSTTMHIYRRPIQFATVLLFLLCVSIFRHYTYSNLIAHHTRADGHDGNSSQHSNMLFKMGSGSKKGLLGSQRLKTLDNSSRVHVGKSTYDESVYSRVLVLPCLDRMQTDWVKDELSDVKLAAYVANDTSAPLHPPKNKGNEVMIYLSYIIDHYADLPDIAIFMHAHRWALHNNELLDHDAVQMIRRLSTDHVVRQGYVNLRCKWEPGCPQWLHTNKEQASPTRQEEMMLSKSWAELFPLEALPPFLAQACCAQFALSRERILSIPLSRFIYYRDWILTTPLSDYISGRIWEYLWQFLFTANTRFCPTEHQCYCDTYGLCFDGEDVYENFTKLRHQKEELESQLEASMKFPSDSSGPEPKDHDVHVEKTASLIDQIQVLGDQLAESKMMALKRGDERRRASSGC